MTPELVRRGITKWAQLINEREISPQHVARLPPTWLPRYWSRMEDILNPQPLALPQVPLGLTSSAVCQIMHELQAMLMHEGRV